MDLDTYIVAVYCAVDDGLRELAEGAGRWRSRGPAPVLADAEVLTLEVVGEYLGLDEDRAIHRYFRRLVHGPGAGGPDHVRAPGGQPLGGEAGAAAAAARPGPARPGALDRGQRAGPGLPLRPRCRVQAAFGRDTGSRAPFYGFRAHFRVCWPGVVTAISLAPANVAEPDLVPELALGAAGVLLGDRNYWNPRLRGELAAAGLAPVAPFRKRSRDPDPTGSRRLNRPRWRIETVAGQFVDRYRLKRVRARDAWHLTARVSRKVLSHTLGVLLIADRRRPLALARLAA